MKRLSLIFSVVLVLLITQVTFAEGMDYTNEADHLKALGLFSGTNNGYELDRAPNRVEGAIMLIRLLGKESEAKTQQLSHPFKDVPVWANAYIGYMYQNGLTKGVSAEEFDSVSPMNGNAYATFVLRALGYDDINGDFSWKTALDFSEQKEIISKNENDTMSLRFNRNEMVGLSYHALNSNLKNTTITLAEQLVEAGAIESDKVQEVDVIVKNKIGTIRFELSVINSDTNTHYRNFLIDVDTIPEYASDISYVTASGFIEPINELSNYLFHEWMRNERVEKQPVNNDYDYGKGVNIGFYKNDFNIINLYNANKKRVAYATFIYTSDGIQEAAIYDVNAPLNPVTKPSNIDSAFVSTQFVDLSNSVEAIGTDGGYSPEVSFIIDRNKLQMKYPNAKFVECRVTEIVVGSVYEKFLIANKTFENDAFSGTPLDQEVIVVNGNNIKPNEHVLVKVYDESKNIIANYSVDYENLKWNDPRFRRLTGTIFNNYRINSDSFYIEKYVDGVKVGNLDNNILEWGSQATSEGVFFSTSPFYFSGNVQYKLVSNVPDLVVD